MQKNRFLIFCLSLSFKIILILLTINLIPCVSAMQNNIYNESNRKIIIETYQDIINRYPTEKEINYYQRRMSDNNWTKEQLRDDILYNFNDLDAIIYRAYWDILGRDPDPEGLEKYRRLITDDNWTEHRVREDLRLNPEYKSKKY